MMTVKTYIKESLIPGAGLGCFAAEFIPKDTLIWRFNPHIDRKLSKDKVNTFLDIEQ